MPQKLAAGRLLVGCLRTRFDPGFDPATLTATEGVWAALPAEALRQSVAPLAYERLRALRHVLQPPDEILDELRSTYVRSAFRNRLVFRELGVVAGALQANGIDVVALKGAHLAALLWDEPALRGMADIDILVDRRRLADAEATLVGLGYGPPDRPDIESYVRRTNHIAPFRKPGAISVEVHWTIERPTSPFRIDPDALLARSVPASIDGIGLRVLAAEDLLLHLALHVAYHHRYARSGLKALCDIAVVLTRGAPDLRTLRDQANEAGAGRFVYSALALVRDVLGVPVDNDVLDGLRHDARDDRAVSAARHFIVTPPEELPVTFQQVRGGRGAADKLHRLLRGVFPEKNRLREIYRLPAGSRRVALYYILRPLDLAVRRGRIVLALVFRSRRLRPTLTWEENRHFISRWVDEAAES